MFGPSYPPVGFYFSVDIMGIPVSFQEVSGLEYEVEFESVKSGGENSYEIKLPTRIKYNNIVLKRGFVTLGNALFLKFQSSFNFQTGVNSAIMPMPLMVNLMDENQSTIASWMAKNAYPVKWNVSPFNAMESKVVIETFEFAHHGIMPLIF